MLFKKLLIEDTNTHLQIILQKRPEECSKKGLTKGMSLVASNTITMKEE